MSTRVLLRRRSDTIRHSLAHEMNSTWGYDRPHLAWRSEVCLAGIWCPSFDNKIFIAIIIMVAFPYMYMATPSFEDAPQFTSNIIIDAITWTPFDILMDVLIRLIRHYYRRCCLRGNSWWLVRWHDKGSLTFIQSQGGHLNILINQLI